MIPYCLYNIQVWGSVDECQCFISCFSLQIWFHCISSVLGIVIMLKNKTIPNKALSKAKEWHDGLKPVCTFQHSWSYQFGQYHQHHWQKCSPKPGQTLPPCFTEGRKHLLFNLSPTLLLTYCRRLDPKISNLDLSLHNTLFHWSSFQSLWALAYLSLFTLPKKWFLGCYPSTKTIPDQASLDCRRVNLASWWSCQMLSQVLAGLPPVSQRRISEKLLIRFWKFSSSPFFVLELSWFFYFFV